MQHIRCSLFVFCFFVVARSISFRVRFIDFNQNSRWKKNWPNKWLLSETNKINWFWYVLLQQINDLKKKKQHQPKISLLQYVCWIVRCCWEMMTKKNAAHERKKIIKNSEYHHHSFHDFSCSLRVPFKKFKNILYICVCICSSMTFKKQKNSVIILKKRPNTLKHSHETRSKFYSLHKNESNQFFRCIFGPIRIPVLRHKHHHIYEQEPKNKTNIQNINVDGIVLAEMCMHFSGYILAQ